MLTRLSLRYLARHPWQSILMILGILLGVAVVVAIDIANASATRGFALSTDAVIGKSTHQLVGATHLLDEAVYWQLRTRGVFSRLGIAATPIFSAQITIPSLGTRSFQLLGVDPFTEPPFRTYLNNGLIGNADSLAEFLGKPGALYASAELANSLASAPGDPLTVQFSGIRRPAFLAGTLQPSDSFSRQALAGMFLADIATVQELTGNLGKIERIDLIIPNASAAQALQAELSRAVLLQPIAVRTETADQMTRAFRINLTALSLLGLVVGMFLIYNTMTFSVVQRRAFFGTLRCLGVTQREIFGLVLGEALWVGTLGAGLGLLCGIALGQGAVWLVTRTLNDLFFTVTVRGVQVPWESLLKGGVLGLIATLVTAAIPAWEATSIPARAALVRSTLENTARTQLGKVTLAGAVLGLLGTALLFVHDSILTSFAATFLIIFSAALLAPSATQTALQFLTPLLRAAIPRLATRDVLAALSRTAVAVASLMIAVSVTIGVRLMVDSFRNTVATWLSQTLVGDIYLSVPASTAEQANQQIDPLVIERIMQINEFAKIDKIRASQLWSPAVGDVPLIAVSASPLETQNLLQAGDFATATAAFASGQLLISEPFANRTGLRLGDVLTLATPNGLQEFPIAGVYFDYASPQGQVAISLAHYQKIWGDTAVTGISLTLQPGQNAEALVTDLNDRLSPLQLLNIRSNRSLRQEALLVFDRTFAITGAMQLLSIVVAFIGVLSALMALQIERQREIGILRTIGLTVRQLWQYVLVQTGIMGLLAGVFAMPTGFVLALILIFIINRRSFGWTLQLSMGFAPFVFALLTAVTAALLAGIYPAWKLSRTSASDAVRFE
jgi:putative ABC transport system permease protein